MSDNIVARDGNGATLNFRTTEISTGLHVPQHRIADGTDVTGATQSAVNMDLLTGVTNGWYNAGAFFSASIQIIASATAAGGQIIFEQTNDNTSTTGIPLPAFEASVLNANPIIAATSIAANTRRMWLVPVTAKYIRVRISTGFSAGTVQAIASFSQQPFANPVINVQQAVGSSLNSMVTGPGSSGAAVSGNPIRIGGSDGSNTRNILTDTNGRLVVAQSDPTLLNAQAVFPPHIPLNGPSALSAANTDLLTGTVSGWMDVSGYQSAAIQIIASAGISAGAIIFEQTNDITNASAGVSMIALEMSATTSNATSAAVTIAASTNRVWAVSILCQYIRVRISTAFVGGTVSAQANFSQNPFTWPTQNVMSASATSFLTTTSPTAATTHRATLAASTNQTSVKTASGNLFSIAFTNSGASARYLKLFNKASAPVIGTDAVVDTYIMPPGQTTVLDFGALGERFTSGIAYAVTGAYGDSDTTAIAADSKITMNYL